MLKIKKFISHLNLQCTFKKKIVYAILLSFGLNIVDVYALPIINDQHQEVPKFSEYIDSQLNTSQMKEFAHMAKALEDHKVSDIPAELINFDHLTGQKVEIINEAGVTTSTFNLSNVVKEIPDTGLDDYVFKSVGNELIIEGMLYGQIVRKHSIPDIQLESYVKDNDFVFILDKRGYAFVIDTTTLLMRSFKGIVPVFKVYDNNKNTKVKLLGKLQPKFVTRGLQPYTKDELSIALTQKDVDGSAIIHAGDIAIEELTSSGKKLKAVLSRDEILKLMKLSFLRLSQTISLSTNEGFGRTLGEKIKYVIGDQSDDKFYTSPYERLQEIVEKYSHELDSKNSDMNKSVSTNNFIEAAVHGFNRSDIILFTDRLNEYAKKSTSERDRFTAQQWASDFKKIAEQAPIKLNELKEEAQKAKGIELRALQQEIGKLEIANTQGYFQNHFRALLKENFASRAEKITDVLPWYKRLNYFELAKFSTRLSIKGMALYGTFKGLDHILDESLSTQFYLATNYIYHQTVFAYLGNHPGYLYPLIGGVVFNLFGILLVENFGKYSMSMLYSYTQLANKFGITKNRFSAKLHSAMGKFALENKDASAYAKIISMTIHLYAAIFFPFYVRIAQGLKQNSLFVSIGAGVSPFLKITPNSNIGKVLNLGAEENSFFTGLTNPFLSKAERESQFARQLDAISVVALEKRNAKDIAMRLATLVISHERNVDPATLAIMANDQIRPEMLNEIFSDPMKSKQWEFISKSVYRDIIDLIFNSENKIDLKQIDPNLIVEAITKINSRLERFGDGKTFYAQAKTLANNFKLGLINFGQAVAAFGKEDYYRLKTLKVSEDIAGSVKSEFRADQFIVTIVPALIGQRARLGVTPPDMWAHGRDHLFFNTKSHGMDIAENFKGHLIGSGPSQVLLYGKAQPVSENYGPVLFDIVENQQKEERLLTGMLSYLKNAFNSSSNSGGRALNSSIRSITNIQVAIFWLVIFRVFGLGQDFWTAFRGYEYFSFLSIPGYAWPWYFIQTANQSENVRINNSLAVQKNAQEKISKALITEDDELLREGYLDLSKVYKQNKNELDISINKIINEAAKKLDLTVHYKNIEELSNRIEKAEYGTLLLGAIVDLQDAIKLNDISIIEKKVEVLRSTMNSDFSPESIEKELKINLYEKARKLLDFSQNFSPLATIPNPKVQGINTFIFGAVLTTVLAVPLVMASIDPDKTTWIDLLGAAITEFLFVGALYFSTGRRGTQLISKWNEWFRSNYYSKLLKESNSLPRKAVGELGAGVAKSIKYTLEGVKGTGVVVGEVIGKASKSIDYATNSSFELCALKLKELNSK